MAMVAINLIGFGTVAYMLINLMRTLNMDWIIGEKPEAPRVEKPTKQSPSNMAN